MKYTVSSLMMAASVLAMSANANAAEYDFKPYVGLDYNYTYADADEHTPKFNSLSVNVGTDYNQYFGTELFYQYSDEAKMHDYIFESKASFQAYGLDLMGYLPLGCDQEYSLIGTVGIGEYKFEEKVREIIGSSDYDDHAIGYRFGAGLQYKIDDKFSVRGLARYVKMDGIDGLDDMWEYTAGIRYNF